MNKNIFMVFISIILSGNLLAYDAQEKQISLRTGDTVEIGLQTYLYEYEETLNGSFYMSNKGTKYGASLSETKTFSDNLYIIGDIRYATGDVKYKSSSTTGNVSDHMYEARLLVGHDTIIGDKDSYNLSPYLGIGYRYLFNDLRDLGSGGYRRESQYIYIPIGLTHRFMIDETSRLSTSIEYDFFARGEQKSYLSDISPAYAAVYGDPVNKQTSGYGLRINTTYERINWSIGLFFNYWNIGDSVTNKYLVGPVLVSLTEPKNETKEVGLQIKYRF